MIKVENENCIMEGTGLQLMAEIAGTIVSLATKMHKDAGMDMESAVELIVTMVGKGARKVIKEDIKAE